MADVRIQDFSGGETDRFRDQKDPRFCKLAKNLYVNTQGKLETRPGYNAFSLITGGAQPFGTLPVERIWHHFTREGTQLTNYRTFISGNRAVKQAQNDSGGWTDISLDVDVGDPAVTQFLPLVSQKDQWNYIRLSDNEFVVTSPTGSYPIKFYRKGVSSVWNAVVLGLPQYNGSDNYVNTTTGGGRGYVWAILLKHEYQLDQTGTGTVTKIVRGAPFFSEFYTDVTEPSVATPSVVSLDDKSSPFFVDNSFVGGSSPSDELIHPDTVWEIYRTKNNGSVFYKVGEVKADGTDFDDEFSDTTIEQNEVLYTTGGVVDNQMSSKLPTIGTFANDALWLASESRVWQSKVGIYDAVPGSFNFDLREGERITAINTIDIYPIVFTNLGVYRIEGIVDDLGNGTHRVRTVSGAETKGALSQKTTVKADNTILYWSTDGIYETNGYTSRKISEHYDDRYCEIIDITADDGGDIKSYFLADGCWDRKNKRVHWFYPLEGETNLTQTLTVDIGNPHEGGYCITSGDVPYQVRSVGSADANIHISNNDGQVLRQYPDRIADAPAGTGTTTGAAAISIKWDYISCSLSFGTDLVRKWFSRLLFNFQNRSKITMSIQSDTDEANDFRDHNPIVRAETTKGFHWLKRGFPKGVLRGAYKQIRVTNSVPQIIYKSDDLGGVTRSGEFITLDTGTWPTDIHGGGDYEFQSALDANWYPVKSISSDDSPFIPTATLRLDGTPSVFSSTPWLLRAVPNDEKLEMNSYTVIFYAAGEGYAQSGVEGTGND